MLPSFLRCMETTQSSTAERHLKSHPAHSVICSEERRMSFLGLDVGLCQFPYLQFHGVQFRKLWFVRHPNDHAEPGHQFLRVRKDKNSPIIRETVQPFSTCSIL